MKQGTDRRALIGVVIGAGFGYAVGTGKSWAWIIAVVFAVIGKYSLEKMDDMPDASNDDSDE